MNTNTMRYLCSLFGASTDDLVTAETPAGFNCGGGGKLASIMTTGVPIYIFFMTTTNEIFLALFLDFYRHQIVVWTLI